MITHAHEFIFHIDTDGEDGIVQVFFDGLKRELITTDGDYDSIEFLEDFAEVKQLQRAIEAL